MIYLLIVLYRNDRLVEMTEQEAQEKWVMLSKAAIEIGIKQSKLSRMARLGQIKIKKDPYDFRVTLVDMIELRKIFPPR